MGSVFDIKKAKLEGHGEIPRSKMAKELSKSQKLVYPIDPAILSSCTLGPDAVMMYYQLLTI